MIGRKNKPLILVVLVVFSLIFIANPIYSDTSEEYKCLTINEDPDDSDLITEGFAYANMFVCPYHPDYPSENPELGLPSCPMGIEYSKFHGGNARYYIGEIDKEGDYFYYAQIDGFGDDDGTAITFTPGNVCYEEIEGDYYVWFQTHGLSTRSDNPSEGFCYNKIHTVNWDSEPGKYCKRECVGVDVAASDTEPGDTEYGWNPTLPCCGDDGPDSDDGYDCAKTEQSNRYMCVQQGVQWWWLDSGASADIGKIKEISCIDASVVSDGNSFLICSNDDSLPGNMNIDVASHQITIGGSTHGYICFNDTTSEKKKIAECVGSGARFSTAGVSKNEGESVVGIDSFTYYCVMDSANNEAIWSPDLDMLEPEDKDGCTNANFVWTGTKCCSEADDNLLGETEYYNDGAGYDINYADSGGCWNSGIVWAGNAAPETGSTIINYKGDFKGCEITDTGIIALQDSHAGGNLVERLNYCKVLIDARGIGSHVFCDIGTGSWQITDSTELFRRTAEWDSNDKGCCTSTQCWAGTVIGCVDSQLYSSEPITYNGYRCVEGAWSDASTIKYTWDSSAVGYCPEKTQCLVNPSPNAPVNCINNKEYDGRKYCENGNWTSRTKLLAVALLQYAAEVSADEYTLLCDKYENLLNYYEYEIGGNSVLNYMGDIHCQGYPCVNEFCVLKYPEGVAFGTSVNEPIGSSKSFLRALNKSQDLCDSVVGGNQYKKCGVGEDVWYNPLHGTVIQLPKGKSLSSTPNWWDYFKTFIKNPFEAFVEKVPEGTDELEFFNQTRMFTKIYADRHSEKKVFAFLEEGKTIRVGSITLTNVDYLGLEYTNLGIAPCTLIRHYDPSIDCTSEQTIFTQSRIGPQKNLVEAWPDLTAKLRIR